MLGQKNRAARQLSLATELFETLANKLDSRISIRLWDGSVVPLGRHPAAGVELSIAGPGVIGSLLRRPTAENLLSHYATGNIDFHGMDLVSFLRTARVKGGSRQRSRSISKLLLARVAICFGFARQVSMVDPGRFDGDDTGRSRKQSDNRDFIQFHYDVSNDFYRLFLDREMVYSCAYFRDWKESLEQAQLNKLEMICRKLQLRPGDRLLDIGCGWGALICYAAQQYGVTAHGVTLSQAQFEAVQQKIVECGLTQRVSVALCDYSELDGSFDKVASVGMAEHVGIANLPGYMRKVRSILAPGGLFLNHAITRPAKESQRAFNRFSPERRLLTKYIFPGGELDHQGHVIDCMEAVGFEVHDVEGWRDHYAQTCEHWARRLEANREEAIRLIGEPKYRMWLLYLAGVCMALSDGSARIFQTLASNRCEKGRSVMPPTREHLYAQRQVRHAA